MTSLAPGRRADVPAPLRPAARDTALAPAMPRVERLLVEAYRIPTDQPESDGTLAWDSTTLVVVHLASGGVHALGYSYASADAARLIADTLAEEVLGAPAMDVATTWSRMVARVRNLGRPGVAATAISAVDNALWDLKARLLGLPLVDLLGAARPAIPAYGSGGFCSYDDRTLEEQLGGWADEGFRFVKMKVGRNPERDPHRLDVARSAIGRNVGLFVDANGAFHPATALAAATDYAARGVTWFEEPVTSDDPRGLRRVRDHAPLGMEIAAGEYGWDADHFRGLLESDAVDVLQADATRCLGATGFQLAAALAEAHHVPLSAHCAPSLHVHLTCAARPAIHLEWFHDHVRIEHWLFDGAPEIHRGVVAPDRSRPGLGLELRPREAAPFLLWRSS